MVINILNIPSSTWYERLSPKKTVSGGSKAPKRTASKSKTEEADIALKVKNIKSQKFLKRCGYRKMVHYLSREFKLNINHKRLYRIMKKNNLLNDKIKKIRRRGKKQCINRNITGPNQLWQFDIKYIYIHGENRFCYLMAFIDVFTRKIINYHIGLQCKGKDIASTLKYALEKTRANVDSLVIRSDNGPQMTSWLFQRSIEKMGLEHEFIPTASPNHNAFIESFFSILDYELINELAEDSFKGVYKEVVDYIQHYNNKRIHAKIGNKTPEEFVKELTDGYIKVA